jgi:hypothetical protein
MDFIFFGFIYLYLPLFTFIGLDPFGEPPTWVRLAKMPFLAQGVVDKAKGFRGGTFARSRSARHFETGAYSFI